MRRIGRFFRVAGLILFAQLALRLLAANAIADWLAVATIFGASLWGAALLWRRYVDPPDDQEFVGNFRVTPTGPALGQAVDPVQAARERDYRAVAWFMIALAMIASLMWASFLLLGGLSQ